MTFDAAKYAAEVRAMGAQELLFRMKAEFRDFLRDVPGAEEKSIISQLEILRRLSGPVDREKLAEMWRADPNPGMFVDWFADLVESGKIPRK